MQIGCALPVRVIVTADQTPSLQCPLGGGLSLLKMSQRSPAGAPERYWQWMFLDGIRKFATLALVVAWALAAAGAASRRSARSILLIRLT
jgi:hypothetical protein